jgi:hypothetical protein
MFKNLNQHIFKSHTKLYLTFENKGKEYLLTAKTSYGKILAENSPPESSGDDHETYYMGEQDKGWYINLYNNKKVTIMTSTINKKTGTESSTTAFKNYEVTFMKRKLTKV